MTNVVNLKGSKKPEKFDINEPLTNEELIEVFLDKYTYNFLMGMFTEIPDSDPDLIEKEQLSKMVAFMRENMKATVHMFTNVKHPLQDIAQEVIQFV